MKIIWSRRALRHLISLRDYISKDSAESAAWVAARILDCTELLITQPSLGRPGRLLGTRELVITGTSYIVPYRIRRGGIELLAVLHGRQKWPGQV